MTSAVDLDLGPAEQADFVARSEPRGTVVGDGAGVPAGADAGHVLPVADLESAFAATPSTDLPTLTPDEPVCIVWTTAGPRRPRARRREARHRVHGDAARCADLRAQAAASGVDLSRLRAVVVGDAPAPPATFDKNAPTEPRRCDLVPGPPDHTAPSGGRP